MSNWSGTLAELVEGSFPGAIVGRQEKLAGDASTRGYLRLHLSGGGAPPTAIAMVLPERTPPNAPELDFSNVQRCLAAANVGVPSILAARDRDLGLLLLEDVGDHPLAEALRGADSPQRLLDATAELLVGIASTPGDGDCVAFRRSHDETLIDRELAMVYAYGLAATDDGPARTSTDPEARAALARLGQSLAAQPRRLMHRDFHAWNVHVDPVGALRVIDFQDAMLGPLAYDLASFCTDRDSDTFVSPERERHLLDAYAHALARTERDLYRDRSALERDYYTCIVFRTLRVIGRFRQLAIEEGNRRYLHYIPRMARQTLRALAALGNSSLADMLASRSPYFE